MTRYTLPHSANQAAAIVAALDTLDGYPRRGVHVGPGPHVPMPATWDGSGPTPPGWTRSHEATEHPADPTRLRVTLTPESQQNLADPGARARLSAPQLALLDGLTMLDTLPAEWVPAPEPLP